MLTKRKFAQTAVCGLVGSVWGIVGTGCLSVRESKFSLYALKYGQSTIAESYVFRNGLKSRRVPISFLFYLLEIDGKRILVDTGCESLRGFKMEHFITPVELLKRYRITPESISDVIVTHAHHDHIGCVHYFRNAVIHIQKDEAAAGAKYLKGLQVEPFDETKTIADCVEVKKIAGHSIGSSIAIIRHQDRRIVLAGDECYVRDCLDRNIPTGASRNPQKSEEFVRTYSSGEYEVYLYHDFAMLPNQNGALKLI
jgi:glyoxylase-like metal-dependent hydrolase (beta-lactamase superfamily II)